MSRKWEPLKKVGIIGVPFEKGQKKYGVSVAPAAVRSAGLIDQLREIGTYYILSYIIVDKNYHSNCFKIRYKYAYKLQRL